MKTNIIYQEASEMVSRGAKFCVDLGKRTLKVNGRWLICQNMNPTDTSEKESLEDTLCHIEELYGIYRSSIPSERTESKKRNYFYALREHELSDDDMMYGLPREIAQFELEFYILISILNGSLYWDEDKMGKWFWHSKVHDDLIILRQWVEGV